MLTTCCAHMTENPDSSQSVYGDWALRGKVNCNTREWTCCSVHYSFSKTYQQSVTFCKARIAEMNLDSYQYFLRLLTVLLRWTALWSPSINQKTYAQIKPFNTLIILQLRHNLSKLKNSEKSTCYRQFPFTVYSIALSSKCACVFWTSRYYLWGRLQSFQSSYPQRQATIWPLCCMQRWKK